MESKCFFLFFFWVPGEVWLQFEK